MPAAAAQKQVVTYFPHANPTSDERDLIMVEPEEWDSYCGILTRMAFIGYLSGTFLNKNKEPIVPAGRQPMPTDCCGYKLGVKLPIYVYELRDGVQYQLRATAGTIHGGVLENIDEREIVTFNMEATATIRYPAASVRSARWLAGPWTTGGAEINAPPLAVAGQTARSPIPIFGTVELELEVRRWNHLLQISNGEMEDLLLSGWAEYVVGLPDGGRPVGAAVAEPPGVAELVRDGLLCGQGRGGGGSGTIQTPDDEDEEPTAEPEDQIIRCEYCEAECEDPEAMEGE